MPNERKETRRRNTNAASCDEMKEKSMKKKERERKQRQANDERPIQTEELTFETSTTHDVAHHQRGFSMSLLDDDDGDVFLQCSFYRDFINYFSHPHTQLMAVF